MTKRGEHTGQAAPRSLRLLVAALVAVLAAGAAWLAFVRGDGLLLDLAGLGKFFCM